MSYDNFRQSTDKTICHGETEVEDEQDNESNSSFYSSDYSE